MVGEIHGTATDDEQRHREVDEHGEHCEAASGETFESFDYISFNVLIGARFYFPFDAFRLWAGVEIGSGRMFFHLKQGEVISNPVTQTVLAEGSAGADLPLGERFGVILKAGIRAQGNTEPMAPFREGITFQMSPGGLFWGVDGSLGAYLRL